MSLAVVSHASGTPVSTGILSEPVLSLEGHKAAVNACSFDPSGTFLATASFDRKILIWEASGTCSNLMSLNGHQSAITDICWSRKSPVLYSVAADKHLIAWDIASQQRIRKFKGHEKFINSVSVVRKGPEIILTGSDDCTLRLWDVRSKDPISGMQTEFPVLSAEFSADSSHVFSAGIDSGINVWDMRTQKLVERMESHSDTVTSLVLNEQGTFLLSNAMDNQLLAWDVRPFVEGDSRLMKRFSGHSHDFEQNLIKCAWDANSDKVAVGSADRLVYVWDFDSQELLCTLPGHKGSVNDVSFHPKGNGNVIASAGSDKKVFVGEL